MYAWIIVVFVYGATDIISEFKVNVSIQYDPHYTIMCRGVDLFSEKKLYQMKWNLLGMSHTCIT